MQEEHHRQAKQAFLEQTGGLDWLSPEDLKALLDELLATNHALDIQNKELRKAQAQLVSMRDRYTGLFEYAPIGYMVLDREGRIIDANLTLTALLQVDREYLIGNHLHEMMDAANLSTFSQTHQYLMESGEQQSCELWLQRPDGSRLRARLDLNLFEIQEGVYHLLVAVSEDTLRWQAERDARDNERRLRFVLENLPVMLVALDEQRQLLVWNAECEVVTGYSPGDTVGNPDAFALLAPRLGDRQKLIAVLADPLANIRHHEVAILCKDGSRKTILWTNHSGRFSVPGWSSWAIGWDITADVSRREEQQDLHTELKALVLQRTVELSRTVDQLQDEIQIRHESEASLQRTNRFGMQLTELATHLQGENELMTVVEVLDSDLRNLGLSSALSLVDPDSGQTSYHSFTLDQATRAEISSISGSDLNRYQPRTNLWDALAGRQIVNREELDQLMARANPGLNENDRLRIFDLLGYTPATLIATLPLITEDRHLGILWLWGEDLRTSDMPALQVFAGQLALILERSRMIERLRNHQERLKNLTKRLVEVQENERRHISLELHDEIGQDLTGLKMILAGCQDEDSEERNEAIAIVDRLMEIVRDISIRLHPPMLDQMGLLPTVLWHIERYTRLTGVKVIISHRGIKNRRFTGAIENATYRVIQEALTNIARHANVKSAAVRLWADDEHIGVKVEDQGCGFELKSVANARNGIGLAGMSERISLLDGTLEISTAINEGTRISVEFPLKKNAIHSDGRDK